MRFEVHWTAEAENKLAECWTESLDRDEVNRAARLIDEILSREPTNKGAEFYGDRILVVGRVQAVFAVIEVDRRVKILDLIWFP